MISLLVIKCINSVILSSLKNCEYEQSLCSTIISWYICISFSGLLCYAFMWSQWCQQQNFFLRLNLEGWHLQHQQRAYPQLLQQWETIAFFPHPLFCEQTTPCDIHSTSFLACCVKLYNSGQYMRKWWSC